MPAPSRFQRPTPVPSRRSQREAEARDEGYWGFIWEVPTTDMTHRGNPTVPRHVTTRGSGQVSTTTPAVTWESGRPVVDWTPNRPTRGGRRSSSVQRPSGGQGESVVTSTPVSSREPFLATATTILPRTQGVVHVPGKDPIFIIAMINNQKKIL